MHLRPYQIEAVDRVFAGWETSRSVLGVAATGTGKTIIFASIIARHPGRTMVIAHREELIFQAADKIKRVTGLDPDIEMAELRADESSMYSRADVVISTIQTQTAGRNGGRMTRFDPNDFGLLIIDEAHHSTASTYRRVIDHYRQNPELHVLGVTATPDRTDEQALGQIFDEVAFEYDIRFGIEDGWLVPITQRAVAVDNLDLSSVRTTAGDLNGAELARVMEYEQTLHEVAAPVIELTSDGQKTLVFAASVAHAERLCEILNRHKANSARWVHGKTPKPERRQMLRDYAERRFQYLVNVGVATEGFDNPGIEFVVMARPTKSRSLYSQMVGRGTRPLPTIVDDPDFFGSASMRRDAIAASTKSRLDVVDFVGNSGRHRLMTTADILGGNYADEVIELARETAEREGQLDTMKGLDDAEREIRARREREKKAQAARRARVVAGARYTTRTIDPFDAFEITPWREKGWDKDKAITPKMANLLERQGVDVADLTFTEARQLIVEIRGRWDSDKCSLKQANILRKRGYSTNVTREQATQVINGIAEREGWRSRKQKAKQSEVVRY